MTRRVDTRKEKARREVLLGRERGLITIEDVACLLGISVVTARGYKYQGIIELYTKNGRADLYDIDEIRWTLRRLRSLRSSKSLREVSQIISEERRIRREQNPIDYTEPLEERLFS